MSNGKLASGILIGAAAGAVLGVLFAPDKGSETRRKISNKSAGIADTLKDFYSQVVNSAEDNYEDVTENSKNLGNTEKSYAFNNEAENAF